MGRWILFICISISSLSLSAQTLNEQYNDLKEGAETFKNYKVIKETGLDGFWSTVMDTVQSKQLKLSETQNLINAQENEILQLRNVIEKKDLQMAEKEHAEMHITVLGIDWQKNTYIIMNAIVITILLIAMAILVFKYKGNSKTARKKSNDYNKLETEFEEYKRNALEKQMKLRRDLQTAWNKLEEIRST